MIIDYKKTEMEKFKNIKCGDVYYDEEGCLCMKLNVCESNDIHINCCYIENGETAWEEGDSMVSVVNGKFVIE